VSGENHRQSRGGPAHCDSRYVTRGSSQRIRLCTASHYLGFQGTADQRRDGLTPDSGCIAVVRWRRRGGLAGGRGGTGSGGQTDVAHRTCACP
jgi:hypothetical protein